MQISDLTRWRVFQVIALALAIYGLQFNEIGREHPFAAFFVAALGVYYLTGIAHAALNAVRRLAGAPPADLPPGVLPPLPRWPAPRP